MGQGTNFVSLWASNRRRQVNAAQLPSLKPPFEKKKNTRPHQVFVKMPSRRNSMANTEHPTPLRRSARFQQQQQLDEDHSTYPKSKSTTNFGKLHLDRSIRSTPNVFAKKTQRGDPEIDTKKSKKVIVGLRNCENLTSGLRRSPRLSNGVEGFSCLRRSPRSFYKGKAEKLVKKARNDTSVRVANKKVKLDVRKAKVGVSSCEKLVKKREMKPRSSRVKSFSVLVEVGERKVRDVDEGKKEIEVKRKRKRGEVGDRICNKGWTQGEEVALQKAYFAVKPTPHFWKKVSKLVPGKSAQDCFNKIHSDHLTPPQPPPRSRANKTNSSPLGNFSLSASKLLKPTEPKTKRPCYKKQKSLIAQKTVRHLLRKHYDVDQDHEVDLFSVLESNTELSTQNFSESILLSTPKHEVEKSGFLQGCERSSSCRKKPLSRFNSLCPTALTSPPVLKQVKNRVLHEKYIDQLHNREAKRKTASARAAKSTPRIGSGKENHFQKLDVVKVALVSDARDAINQFRHLQANASVNSSELDDDGVDTDTDDEGD